LIEVAYLALGSRGCARATKLKAYDEALNASE
jgi:hypothetical protein